MKLKCCQCHFKRSVLLFVRVLLNQKEVDGILLLWSETKYLNKRNVFIRMFLLQSCMRTKIHSSKIRQGFFIANVNLPSKHISPPEHIAELTASGWPSEGAEQFLIDRGGWGCVWGRMLLLILY